MELFFQLIANAMAKWCVYGLLACGFGILYRALRVFHVAYAAIVIVAPYAALALAARLPLAAALGGGVAVAVMLALLCEALVFRPLTMRRVGAEGGMIASLGLYLVLQNLLVVVFGPGLLVIGNNPVVMHPLGPVSVSSTQIVYMEVAAAVALASGLLATRNPRLLVQIRALGDQPQLLAFHGGRISRLRLLVWVSAAALGGVAGVLYGADVGVDPHVGMQMFLGGAVAVFLGGRDRVAGWLVGALCVALVENLIALWLGMVWAPTVVYAVILVVLHFRPRGMLTLQRRTREEA